MELCPILLTYLRNLRHLDDHQLLCDGVSTHSLLWQAFQWNYNSRKMNIPYEEKERLALGGWNVVLLMDTKERKHPKIKTMRREDIVADINHAFGAGSCEVRTLQAGDYAWIARKEGFGERVLDCIIERKTLHDLTKDMTRKSGSCHPLSKMEAQMKKMESTTLSNKIFLLEDRNDPKIRHVPGSILDSALEFDEKIRNGQHPGGFSYKETKSIVDTVLFLKNQHRAMRNKIKAAYAQALVSLSEGASVDEQMLKLAPFATVGTVDNINERIQQALGQPEFLYYRQLRSVRGVGEYRTKKVTASFPTKESLQQYAKSQTRVFVATMKRISGMDEDTAKRVRDCFLPSPAAEANPIQVTKRKQAPLMVTPQGGNICSKRPHNVASRPHNPRCRQFARKEKQRSSWKTKRNMSAFERRGDDVFVGSESVLECEGGEVVGESDDEVIVESDDDTSILESKDDNVAVESGDGMPIVEWQYNKGSSQSEDEKTKPKAPTRRRLLWDPTHEDKSKLWDDSSSDDGSLFDPIFPKSCRKAPLDSEGSTLGRALEPRGDAQLVARTDGDVIEIDY